MKNNFIRAAVLTVALFYVFMASADADFSTNSLFRYITGIPGISDSFDAAVFNRDHPALMARDYGRYVEFAGIRQEVVRSLNNEKKDIAHGVTSLSVKYSLIQDRAGITLGRQFSGDGGGSLQVVEVTGKLPCGVSGSLRYFSVPYEWGIGVSCDDITKMLPSRFRDTGFEGVVMGEVLGRTHYFVLVKKRTIETPESYRGAPDRHAQVWDMDMDGWKANIRYELLRGIDVSVDCGKDMLSGDMGLWFNRAQYMRGMLDGDTYRFGTRLEFSGSSRYVPDLSYNRTTTDCDLTHGIADSWPFTPVQMEIIGDKTWTFSGRGRIVSDAGTFLWKLSQRSQTSLTLARAHFDYRFRIVTRDHLSMDPMNMIIGRSRTETDRTRYFDFALISYRRTFKFERCFLEMGVSQFIPVHHSGKKIPGKAPAPPSFPKLKVSKPKRVGGLSFDARLIWKL